ncbi:hypothetical protein JHK85_053264 [Glycine max]|nr:hypothetical protein JHK85_053264 [Glycine max]
MSSATADSFRALLAPCRCRPRFDPFVDCPRERRAASSAVSFSSPAGGGNGDARTDDGCGSGSESRDANLKLVGDVAQELFRLSPDVIILDVSVATKTESNKVAGNAILYECV